MRIGLIDRQTVERKIIMKLHSPEEIKLNKSLLPINKEASSENCEKSSNLKNAFFSFFCLSQTEPTKNIEDSTKSERQLVKLKSIIILNSTKSYDGSLDVKLKKNNSNLTDKNSQVHNKVPLSQHSINKIVQKTILVEHNCHKVKKEYKIVHFQSKADIFEYLVPSPGPIIETTKKSLKKHSRFRLK